MMKRSELPRHAGAGFKPEHLASIDTGPQPVGFFEVHAENYMGAGGPPHAQLGRLRETYALSVHGVGLSIGSMQSLDKAHLTRLKRLCDRYDPASVSEHLAWSSHDSTFLNDLLPLPYTETTLSRVVDHIDKVQETLGRQILLENPATYLLFEESTIPEPVFLAAIVRRTGCGLLLDLNNVVVASTNHRQDPHAYLAAFPMRAVGEIHLAGHMETIDDAGAPLLIDSHDAPVQPSVWALYDYLIERTGPLPTLIEWDNDVPEWPDLLREVMAAQVVLDRAARTAA